MNRINKLYVTIGMVVAFGQFFEIAAHAGENSHCVFLRVGASPLSPFLPALPGFCLAMMRSLMPS